MLRKKYNSTQPGKCTHLGFLYRRCTRINLRRYRHAFFSSHCSKYTLSLQRCKFTPRIYPWVVRQHAIPRRYRVSKMSHECEHTEVSPYQIHITQKYVCRVVSGHVSVLDGVLDRRVTQLCLHVSLARQRITAVPWLTQSTQQHRWRPSSQVVLSVILCR